MKSSELAALITTLAIIISENIPDNDDLEILSAAITQLGDTLATIATQRSLILK